MVENESEKQQQQETVQVNNDYATHATESQRTTIRYFWDGGISANTPLREAIISHRQYWANVKRADYIPGLQIAIVNLHSHKQE